MPYLNSSNYLNETPWLNQTPEYIPTPAPAKRTEEKAPNPFGGTRTSRAYEDMRKVESDKPVQPKPNMWRALAAIGTGFAINYANQGGRMRPVDATPAMRSIALGDYDYKVADWKDRLDRSRSTFDDARQADAVDLEAQSQPARTANLEAQTATMQANLAAKTQPVRDEIDKSEIKEGSDGFYQVLTYKDGRTVTSRLTIPHSEAAKVATGQPVEAVSKDGRPVFIQRNMTTGAFEEVPGFVPPPDAPKEPRAGLTPGEALTQQRFNTNLKLDAEDYKTKGMDAVQKEWQESLINQLSSTKTPRQPTIDDVKRLREARQAVQNNYETRLRTAGIPFEHYEFPQVGSVNVGGGRGAEWAPPAAPTKSSTPNPVDPQVKEYADKYFGGDVNKAMEAIQQQRSGR